MPPSSPVRSLLVGSRRATWAAGFLLALALLGSSPSGAWATTGSEVDSAKAKVERLEREVEAANSELSKLQERSAALVDRLSVAEGELERIDAALAQTRAGVEEARTAYEEVRRRLDARAHMTYMEGPAGNVGFLLGAASFADLADRLEFIDAVTQSDMDIANEAENLRLALLAEERRQESLRADQAEVVGGERADLSQLRSQLEEQQRMLATVEAEEREAEQAAQVLSRQYQQQVANAFRGPVGNGPIRVCPVGQPRGFGDDFGAPRYAGGYHPHAGNDIFAPTGTPIYAPFDGYAYDASNTLGGLSVIVRGSEGYVYNAHLSRFGELGNVSTGDVIGYVGATGDTSTPHDHFEWHPNVTPTNWPASQYGYSVIPSSYGSPAVNPRPLLLDVC